MVANKYAHTLIILVAFFAVSGAVAAANNLKAAIADYTRPLSFEPNQGQTDKQIDFLARGSAYRLFLAHGEATLALKNGIAVRMRLAHAAVSSLPEALDPQPSKSNYFLGNVPERWHTNIPNYAKVRYRNVYPGIDLIYYGNQRQLEYDMVVAPGADPHQIALRFEGAGKADLERSGDLVMHTAAGELRWHKPVAYQEVNGSRKLIACDYMRKDGDKLAFTLGAYDRTKPLIVDPVLVYSTYLGGSGDGDAGNAIAVDASGNAYVTGSTTSANFPTTKNAFQSSYLGSFNFTPNAFVSKFNTSGELVYSTYLGGSGNSSGTEGDVGRGIAVDAYGNAYITGATGSYDFPTQHPFQASLGGTCQPPPLCYTTNAFVTKLAAAGNALIYSTFLGGRNSFEPEDVGKGISVDTAGNAYVGGVTNSTDFPTNKPFDKTPGSGFVTKFDAGGTALVYSTYFPFGVSAIAVDTCKNVYITGAATSGLPARNAFQSQPKSAKGNAFVTKLDAAGTALVYSTYLGGSGGDAGNGIAVDTQGHAYVTGVTHSYDFPRTNAFQESLKSPAGNAFVTKFHYDGASLFYSTYLGGSGSDSGNAITVDSGDHAFVTGVTTSSDFPTEEAFQTELKSPNGNAFITKFHYDGVSLFYSSYLGGSGTDSGNGIGVDKYANGYVVGTTSSSDFPTTKNAFQPELKSAFGNAFVTKISAQ